MFRTIINLILLLVIIIIIFNSIKDYEKFDNNKTFKLQDQNIDNLFVIDRNKEYNKYINQLYDDKKILFTDKQLADLKRPNQIYDITNINNPQNLTVQITNKLDNNTSDTTQLDDIKKYNDFPGKDVLIQDSTLEYTNIINNMKKDINTKIPFNCDDVAIMNNPKYLKNYYMDFNGNYVKSNLVDYFTDYNTNINNNDQAQQYCIPVNTIKGQSNMIIPDQYNVNKYLTNAYNIDWSRVINPNTIY